MLALAAHLRRPTIHLSARLRVPRTARWGFQLTTCMSEPAIHTSTSVCRAFVGGDAVAAHEYHDCDFCFEGYREEVERRTDRQAGLLDDGREVGGLSTSQAWQPDNQSWDKFHRRDNATARFYKERRYLLLEFPALANASKPQHIVEIGCGCGSSLLPILKANPSCRVTATDVSPTAIAMFRRAADAASIAPERINAFPLDSTVMASNHNGPFEGLEADGLLLIFTLAALLPEQMPGMLQNAFQALHSGGLLFIRDHGLYDLTHLRLTGQQRIGHRLYRRQDGTTCYFFTTQDLQAKLEDCGFQCVECRYACVSLSNRKRDFEMKRVFVHGVFRKP